MSRSGAAAVDPDADALFRELVGDVLQQVRMDEVFHSAIRAAEHLLSMWEHRPSDPPSPHEVWASICEQDPRAGCFPLGTIAERTVRRAVRDRSSRSGDGAASPARAYLLHRLLTIFLFEAALLDLRGSSGDPARDYGFQYHWRDGKFRPAADELALRERLWQASCRNADRLLGAWEEARTAGAGPADADVDAALRRVFGVGPLPRARRLRRAPVTVLGSKPEADLARTHGPIRSDAREIVLRGPGFNVRAWDRDLVGASGGALDSRVRDLLDIAITFYLGDIYVPRRALFGRELVVLMPVQNRRLWEEHGDLLARIGSFLTGNEVEFRFLGPDGDSGRPPSLGTTADDRCVCLFSGGLDSFVGAAVALGEERSKVYLVSLAASPSLGSVQRGLFARLAERDCARHVVFTTGPESVGVPRRDRLGSQPEQALYQHGRSFLFLSLATVVALSNGIGEIHVYENGPVALNPPFSEARFNTRTTHPVFLELFGELVRGAFEVELRIHNPFALLTKGEVVGRLDPSHLPALRETNSCWSYAKVLPWARKLGLGDFDGRHCGRCVPCVWRRAAVERAGLAHYDDEYLWDAVPPAKWGKWLDRPHFTLLLDLYRACRSALAVTDDELLDLCPELDQTGPGSLSERLDLYRRYSAEVVAWFDRAKGMRYRA
jgi:7-cyano-7-deazaguanine synthase in queuosine biosynthesis